MANAQKQSLVSGFTSALEQTKNFALIKFEKTKHTTLEGLRRELRKNDASLEVVKNTLFEKTVNKLAQQDKTLNELRSKAFPLKEPSAILFLKGDFSAGLKAFFDFADKDKSLSFKIGHIDSIVYEKNDLEKIAKLPGKDQLVAKLIGTMKNPMSKTVYSIKGPLQKLAYVLSQRGQQTS